MVVTDPLARGSSRSIKSTCVRKSREAGCVCEVFARLVSVAPQRIAQSLIDHAVLRMAGSRVATSYLMIAPNTRRCGRMGVRSRQVVVVCHACSEPHDAVPPLDCSSRWNYRIRGPDVMGRRRFLPAAGDAAFTAQQCEMGNMRSTDRHSGIGLGLRPHESRSGIRIPNSRHASCQAAGTDKLPLDGCCQLRGRQTHRGPRRMPAGIFLCRSTK